MKRLLITVLLAILAMPCIAQPRDTVRVLAIGDSFSQDAVEQYLYDIAYADGVVLIIGNLYINNCSLAKHFLNMRNNLPDYSYRKINGEGVSSFQKKASISMALEDETWDYISIQQANNFSGFFDTYEPYLRYLHSFFEDNISEDTRLMWHQTWAYEEGSTHSAFPNYNNDQHLMYKMISDASKKASYGYMMGIIPSGTAVQTVRDYYRLGPMTRDGYHLSYDLGRYVVACVWYESLTHRSVLFNTYYPETLDIFQAYVAQRAAHDAVLKPFSVN